MRAKKFSVDAGFFLLLALMFGLLDTAVAASALFAGAVHELGHIAAAKLCGGGVRRLRLGLWGAELSLRGGLGYGAEALCALAGPGASIVLAAALSAAGGAAGAEWLYLPAGSSLILGIFNLLPARALDGGRAAYMLVCGRRGIEEAERAACVLSCVSAGAVLVLGVLAALETGRNFTLLVMGILLLFGECRRLTKKPG